MRIEMRWAWRRLGLLRVALAVIAGIAGMAGVALAEPAPPTVAFTFDDGPRLAATPRLSPAERNQAMLEALKKHGVTAALFVTSGNGANRPEGLALTRAWGEAGHAIGNHTVTHPDLNSDKVSLEAYQQEVLDCDKLIAALYGTDQDTPQPELRWENVYGGPGADKLIGSAGRDGEFVVRGVPPGRYAVRATARELDHALESRAEATAQAGDVLDLVLPPFE